MNGKYRIIKNLNQRQLLFSIQFQCKCTVDIALHISCDTVARESLKKGREKKYYKWPPLWGSAWRFSSRDKMDGDRVLRNFFDGVTLSRRYLWGVSNLSFKEKGFLEFLLFSIFFCFFLLLEKIREWKRLDYFGEMLDGITHLLGFIKVQDRKTFSQAPADVFNKGGFWR